MTQVILDGTLTESDRVAGMRENGDQWFSCTHQAFGGNVQFLSATTPSPPVPLHTPVDRTGV
ncbi:hypothetical protein [Streptomyces sp. NPDC002769]|uniref:hypothetical protein n=1 Tax=Streptomyces sp. NPDC002769 TaxID=3154542 RepID=UPI003332ED29